MIQPFPKRIGLLRNAEMEIDSPETKDKHTLTLMYVVMMMFANLLSLHSQTSSHQQGAIRISCLFVLTETGMFLYAFIEGCTVVLGSCYNISLVCLLFFVWVYKLFLFSDLETSLMHHCWSFFCCRMLAVIIWAYV